MAEARPSQCDDGDEMESERQHEQAVQTALASTSGSAGEGLEVAATASEVEEGVAPSCPDYQHERGNEQEYEDLTMRPDVVDAVVDGDPRGEDIGLLDAVLDVPAGGLSIGTGPAGESLKEEPC
eukprot:3036842-Pyramimonas_sp.AAC.1